MPSSRRPLHWLAGAAALATLGAFALTLAGDPVEGRTEGLLKVLVAASFLSVGLFAWMRRPDNRFGAVMTGAGFAWLAGSLTASTTGVFYTAGLFLGALAVPTSFSLLSFPTGRLQRSDERLVVGCAWVWATVLIVPAVLLGAPGFGRDDERNLALVTQNATLSDVAGTVFMGIAGVLALALVVVAARRWRDSDGAERRELAPVLWTGMLAAGLFAVHATAEAVTSSTMAVDALFIVNMIVLIGLPLAFLAGLVRARVIGRAAVAELVERLETVPAPGALRDMLAQALRDPSLQLAYWVPTRGGGYVDADGAPVRLPESDPKRAWTPVTRDGRPVAAIVHDAALAREPDAVRAAGAAAALALENERLEAELRARVAELHTSRARIIAVGDAERRRLERDLHDGAQQRLVALALALRMARSRVETDPAAAASLLDTAMTQLTEALSELRELARGIHPAVLTDRGLHAALEALAGRAPVEVELATEAEGRLPAQVEAAAYFVVAEALTNVAKYAGAERAVVRVAREDGHAVVEVRDDGRGGADPAAGSGLRGLADRIAALDGRLVVHSPPGRGTVVRAEIPCPA
jgi:signal transduction histidine kinase